VIIREKRKIAGKEAEVKVYKTSEVMLSKEEREQAEELDRFLGQKMKETESRLRKKSLLELKGRKGVLKLWFELGKELSFVDDRRLVREADKRWLWRAFYDHAPNLAPGPLNVRANERPENSHFHYCYLLAKKFPDFKFVDSAGDWTAWAEFLDSPSISEDSRIIEWLATKQQKYAPSAKQDWLRRLTREIRNEFPYKGARTDTSMFSDEYLIRRLEEIYRRIYGETEEQDDRRGHSTEHGEPMR
jgi:hypothetical protein